MALASLIELRRALLRFHIKLFEAQTLFLEVLALRSPNKGEEVSGRRESNPYILLGRQSHEPLCYARSIYFRQHGLYPALDSSM